MGAVRILGKILGNNPQSVISRFLVQLGTHRGPVKAVYAQECRLVRERTAGKVRQELREIGLGGVIILETIIAHSPVELHRVIFRGAVRLYGKTLEEACIIGTRLAASVISTKENVCPRFLPEEFDL